jgi:hypothetical protein
MRPFGIGHQPGDGKFLVVPKFALGAHDPHGTAKKLVRTAELNEVGQQQDLMAHTISLRRQRQCAPDEGEWVICRHHRAAQTGQEVDSRGVGTFLGH